MSLIKTLTPTQEARHFSYQQRWQRVMVTAPSLPRSEVVEAIARLYRWMGLPVPQVHFCVSPLVAFQHLASNPQTPQYEPFLSQALTYLDQQIRQQIRPELASIIDLRVPASPVDAKTPDAWVDFRVLDTVRQTLERGFRSQSTNPEYADVAASWLNHCVQTEQWAVEACWIDFCISELGCVVEPERWEVLQILVQGAGWIFPLDAECWVCDRPHLSFDSQGQLHRDGEPAVSYEDGWALYFWHGHPLPVHYGSVLSSQWQAAWYEQEVDVDLRRILLEQLPSSQWQANWYANEPGDWLRQMLLQGIPSAQFQPQWLLSEPNSDLRRQILSALPYKRIVEELHPEEVDAWDTYRLLQIELSIGNQSNLLDEDLLAHFMAKPEYRNTPMVMRWLEERWVCFLTMTCPSTGHEHILHVPPTMQSAREAIRWVNWDIDPTEFAVQT